MAFLLICFLMRSILCLKALRQRPAGLAASHSSITGPHPAPSFPFTSRDQTVCLSSACRNREGRRWLCLLLLLCLSFSLLSAHTRKFLFPTQSPVHFISPWPPAMKSKEKEISCWQWLARLLLCLAPPHTYACCKDNTGVCQMRLWKWDHEANSAKWCFSLGCSRICAVCALKCEWNLMCLRGWSVRSYSMCRLQRKRC